MISSVNRTAQYRTLRNPTRDDDVSSLQPPQMRSIRACSDEKNCRNRTVGLAEAVRTIVSQGVFLTMKSARRQFFVHNSIARLYTQPCTSHFRDPRSLRFTFPRHLSSSSQLQGIHNSLENLTTEADRRKAALKRVLIQYQELHGNMFVPLTFVVPSHSTKWPEEMWGIMLGHVVSSIRAGLSYMSMRDELEDIGFVFDFPSHESIRVAFMKYKDMHGDMPIQRNFVVPVGNSIWPRRTWGLKLGLLTKRIQAGSSLDSLRKELEEHGYDCNYQSCMGYDEESIQLGLLKYCELHRKMLVPLRFKVPKNSEEWPQKTWRMPLGVIVTMIRNNANYRGMRERLKSRGLNCAPFRLRQYSEDAARLLLCKYHELHGNFDVSHVFVVPSDSDDWPLWMRGTQLGALVKRARHGHSLKGMRNKLEEIGFSFEMPEKKVDRHGDELILLALQTYKKLYGNLMVPGAFIIPHDTVDWPEQLWGKALGSIVGRIRIGRCYLHMVEKFNEIGFKWYGGKFQGYDDDIVMLALTRYKKLHGNTLVPAKFIVPKGSEEWPESLWQMQLGICVTKIRIGTIHISISKELSALGLDYYPRSAKK